jgi:hypothetical protein
MQSAALVCSAGLHVNTAVVAHVCTPQQAVLLQNVAILSITAQDASKKGFATLKAYINLFRGLVQCFELSYVARHAELG